MKAILKINGKEIEVEISEEQFEKLKEKKSPFARTNKKFYWYINGGGQVMNCIDNGTPLELDHYNSANYCTDKDLLQQQAYRETLNRLLWRWQYENDEPVDWDEPLIEKFCIVYDHEDKKYGAIARARIQPLNSIGFSTRAKARQAIKEVVEPFIEKHPDFVR